MIIVRLICASKIQVPNWQLIIENNYNFTSQCFFIDEQITWVDYYGKIPPNAVIAGTKEDGSNVYIGQVYHARDGRGIGITPVEIAKGDLVVQVADNYKIYPQKMMIKVKIKLKKIINF